VAHRFDSDKYDPYSEAAQQVESHAFAGPDALDAGASENLYSQLAAAIVAALGDIGATAFRLGLTQQPQIQGVAEAVAAVAKPTILSYLGEVDPEPALRALEQDPRLETLSAIDQDEMKREIGQTRQLEDLVLRARRLPDLIDFAGTMGLRIPEGALDNSPYIIPGGELPSPETQ